MGMPNNSSEDQNSFLGDCYSGSSTRDGTSSPTVGTKRQRGMQPWMAALVLSPLPAVPGCRNGLREKNGLKCH